MNRDRLQHWRNRRGIRNRLWAVTRKGAALGTLYAYTKVEALEEARRKYGRGVTVTVS
jgi:hypothetical protein